MFRTTCKSCGMPILWVKTRSGKAMPCDIKPIRFRIDDSAQVLERFVTKKRRHPVWSKGQHQESGRIHISFRNMPSGRHMEETVNGPYRS